MNRERGLTLLLGLVAWLLARAAWAADPWRPQVQAGSFDVGLVGQLARALLPFGGGP